jgi:hypothetical protein
MRVRCHIFFQQKLFQIGALDMIGKLELIDYFQLNQEKIAKLACIHKKIAI